ncbi:MAG: MFS transporter [Candidatus Accumulibacter sp.]|jgi:sugar phosphate permease|nr:MFS transporter [Accumulibacter sp.]
MTPPSARWFRLFLPFAGGYFLSYLYRTVNAVVGPVLSNELSLGAADLGLLTSTYFIAFGAAQLPLGILLDRYGARRIEAGLLLLAAAGAAVFACSDGIVMLAVGRGLIGLGVSACLMAAFKFFSQWFTAERQASLTGWIMTSGTLGALAASAPLDAVLRVASWREVFFGLSAITAGIIVWLWRGVPEKPPSGRPQSFAQLAGGLRQIVGRLHFWRFATISLAQVGGFMAVQSLWSSAWLIHVNGYSRSEAAAHLTMMNASMAVAYFLIGLSSTWLARRGVQTIHLLGGGLTLALLSLLAIVTQASGHHYLLWGAYGFFSSVGTLNYGVTAAGFSGELSGRVNTLLNLLSFVGAFMLQWGMGLLIDALKAAGHSPASAHTGAFVLLCALQAASLSWFCFCGWRARREAKIMTTSAPAKNKDEKS